MWCIIKKSFCRKKIRCRKSGVKARSLKGLVKCRPQDPAQEECFCLNQRAQVGLQSGVLERESV